MIRAACSSGTAARTQFLYRLLKEGRLPWQMVTATVLFTDLRGYSSVAEGRSPIEIIAWLNEYQSAMTEIVLQHQGIVKDFTGDGMRAVLYPYPALLPQK
ncbi:MAG: adenylate/guanylate cyclase domain-containing protein [Hormoscilla sp. GUM202]|nr:adenylate/guanylate cyclase domain-containing protein [Hormoscilla sp. GUM202]